MKTDHVRSILTVLTDRSIINFPWGFQAVVNGWQVSCHYQEFTRGDDFFINHDQSRVRAILIPMTRDWTAAGAFRRFRTLRSALAYSLADAVQLTMSGGPIEVGFLLSLNCRLSVRVYHPLQNWQWITDDPHAVGLLRACFPPGYWSGRVAMPPEQGLLADWLLDHGPDWLIAPP